MFGRALQRRHHAEVGGDGVEVAGIPELRDQVAELLQQLHHPPDVVLVGVGGNHQRDRVLLARLGGLQGDQLGRLQGA
jgi:hypothetical protein